MPARMVIQSNDLSWRNLKKHKKLFRFQRYLLAAERSKKEFKRDLFAYKNHRLCKLFCQRYFEDWLWYLSPCLLSVNKICGEI
jgi:hypothetical protein